MLDFDTVIRDPKSIRDMRPGRAVGRGLYATWTLITATMLGEREGVLLAVREHHYHPFVTERFGFREQDGDFVVWAGTYHETIASAVDEFRSRGGFNDPDLALGDHYVIPGLDGDGKGI